MTQNQPDQAEDNVAESRIAELEAKVRELVEREKNRAELINYASDGMVVVSQEGEVLEANPSFLELFGFEEHDVVGNAFSDFISEDDVKRRPIRLEFLALGGEICIERRLKARNGALIDVEIHSRGLPDRRILGIIRDIRKRKQAEDALRTSESRLRALLSGIPDLIIRMNRDGVYLDCTDATGFPTVVAPNVCLGTNVRDCMPKHIADQRMELIERSLDTQKTQRAEHQVEIDGEQTWFETHVAPIDDNEVIVVVRDVSLRKKAEEERRRVEGQFRQIQKLEAVGRLIGGVAHDFNNLLTPIIGRSELAILKLGESNPAIRSELETILEAGTRASDLTRQLLAFARKRELNLIPMEINFAVSDFSRMLQRMIGEDVELQVNLNDDELVVRADKTQLQQVLMNLAVNARDAMPEGGVLKVETSRSRMPSRSGSSRQAVQIRVEDSGTGMDQETLERIFEPYFSTKAEDKGSGVGLSTVYSIVSEHGGYVFVESNPGSGTVFKVFLPLCDDELSREESARLQKLEPSEKRERVLLVEDNELVRELTKEVLEQHEFDVEVAASGPEALKILGEEPFDVLLTDVIMPEMDGKELADAVSAHQPGIRVLYMSGYTANVISSHGVKADGRFFIQKPFTPGELVLKIQEILDDLVEA